MFCAIGPKKRKKDFNDKMNGFFSFGKCRNQKIGSQPFAAATTSSSSLPPAPQSQSQPQPQPSLDNAQWCRWMYTQCMKDVHLHSRPQQQNQVLQTKTCQRLIEPCLQAFASSQPNQPEPNPKKKKHDGRIEIEI